MEITPELADNYEGVIRKLICVDCLKPFYISPEVLETLNPRYCHACSVKRVAEEEKKQQQEAEEQEKEAREALVCALFDDLASSRVDTPEEALVRSIVETRAKFRGDELYGYKMLLCVPNHSDRGRAWDVTMTKDDESTNSYTSIRLVLIEFDENFHMLWPYSARKHYYGKRERMEDIDKLIAKKPTEADFYAKKAEKLVELGEDEQGIEWYDRAIALDDLGILSGHYYCDKGDVLARLERNGEAMACYDKAISLNPDDAFYTAHKAQFLEKLGREEETLALYDTFIATHPTDQEMYAHKAFFYVHRGNYEEARAIHERGKQAVEEIG